MAVDKWKLREWMLMPDDDLAQAVEKWLQPYQTNEFWDRPVTTTYTRGVFVDPEKFDITPRPEYKRQLITAKEDRLKKLEEEIDLVRKEIKELRQ